MDANDKKNSLENVNLILPMQQRETEKGGKKTFLKRIARNMESKSGITLEIY